MEVAQLDLSLRVAVCAWCKPAARHGEAGLLSHGICPRHLRKFKLEVQGILPQRRRRAAARSARDESLEALLL